ncbi:MAG: hypothetical protein LAT68_11825 [Cyclobacteriaceae bacterium]|nr:hypothetical protein [Cyclobacteriaceae bacterium]MCH8517005.1 hypothetical protein [Cyclobacteriaceae bacterium]
MEVVVCIPNAKHKKDILGFLRGDFTLIRDCDLNGFKNKSNKQIILFCPDAEDILPAGIDEYHNLILVQDGVFQSITEEIHYFPEFEGIKIGINSLPGSFTSPILEMSIADIYDEQEAVKEILQNLIAKPIRWVADGPGMVSPRIICMLINEAYYTWMEGTADPASIDLGMKLGTNYPKGPFEWLDLWGIDKVVKIIEAVYQYTGDPRYKCCPLLKKQAWAYLANRN